MCEFYRKPAFWQVISKIKIIFGYFKKHPNII
jgi:hypothetical protein